MDMSKLAFLDLDGVICNDGHRVQHALDRQWYTYFDKIPDDECWPQGKELYDSLVICDYEIVYLTGRREDTREKTMKWLKRHGFSTDYVLIMRKFMDRRPLGEFKAAVVWQVAELFDEIRVYDDDPSVIEQVQKLLGGQAGYHCTWYTKPERMIRTAKS